MRLLFDTCAILWAVSSPERIPQNVYSVLEANDTEVLVSVISLAEIACAVERGRIGLDRHWRVWFQHFVEANGWECLPIDADVIGEAFSLAPPFHPDPADRIIVATARIHAARVVTADRKILAYPHVQTLWE